MKALLRIGLLFCLTAFTGCGDIEWFPETGSKTGTDSKPVIQTFTMPATATELRVAVTAFTAQNATGFLITGNPLKPALNDTRWSATPPTEYIFASPGAHVIYAWVKNATEVSDPVLQSVTTTKAATDLIEVLDVQSGSFDQDLGQWWVDLSIENTGTTAKEVQFAFAATDAAGKYLTMAPTSWSLTVNPGQGFYYAPVPITLNTSATEGISWRVESVKY